MLDSLRNIQEVCSVRLCSAPRLFCDFELGVSVCKSRYSDEGYSEIPKSKTFYLRGAFEGAHREQFSAMLPRTWSYWLLFVAVMEHCDSGTL